MASFGIILLAAGYGTRLYPLTKHRPKALLPLGQGVMLDQIMRSVREVKGSARLVLVTNHSFAAQCEAWRAAQRDPVELVDDGTTDPEHRRGAIRDLLLGWKRAGTDDVLVIGTDNVFTWSLSACVAFAKAKAPASTVAIRQMATDYEASRYGVVEQARGGRIVRCVEKPAQPSSRAIALCVYYFPSAVRARAEEFLKAGGSGDAPGHFIAWLVAKEPVYGYPTEGDWFDVGSRESYAQVTAWWAQRGTQPAGTSRSG